VDELAANQGHDLQVAQRTEIALDQRRRPHAAAAEPGGPVPGDTGAIVAAPPVGQATPGMRRHHLEVAPGAMGALDEGGNADDACGEGCGGLGLIGMPVPGPPIVSPVVIQTPPGVGDDLQIAHPAEVALDEGGGGDVVCATEHQRRPTPGPARTIVVAPPVGQASTAARHDHLEVALHAMAALYKKAAHGLSLRPPAMCPRRRRSSYRYQPGP
jgi:hypothetical protein